MLLVKTREKPCLASSCLNLYLHHFRFLPLSAHGPLGLHGGSDSEESAHNGGDPSLILGLERFPGEGSGNPLQYSCLENSIDRSLAGYSLWGYKESGTTEQLTDFSFSPSPVW